MVDIQWNGLDEMKVAMRVALQRSEEQVGQVIYNNTEEMKSEAMRIAPVDTWFMHDSIYTFHSKLAGEVISPAGYSGFVNFGTRKMMAQPFMTNSFTAQVEKVRKDIIDVARGLFK